MKGRSVEELRRRAEEQEAIVARALQEVEEANKRWQREIEMAIILWKQYEAAEAAN